MKNILVADQIADKGVRHLQAKTNLTVDIKVGLNEDELCKIIADYEGLSFEVRPKLPQQL